MTCQIDHIVLLVSTPFFDNPPPWLTDNFTITPGGKHTGQASRNKLIIFEDGTYLELFNWYDTPPALDDVTLPMRVWGSKKEGLIDFALTCTEVSAEECIGGVNERISALPNEALGLGITYGKPISGGRKKDDGVGIKWQVTRPIFDEGMRVPEKELFPGGRLDAPFFCHDVTDRALRVASDDSAKTTHPCGATGIAEVQALVPPDRLSDYSLLWSKIAGSKLKNEKHAERGDGEGRSFSFDIGVPKGDGSARIVVREAKGKETMRQMIERGIGFSSLVLATSGGSDSGRTRVQFGNDGIESTIWLEK